MELIIHRIYIAVYAFYNSTVYNNISINLYHISYSIITSSAYHRENLEVTDPSPKSNRSPFTTTLRDNH